MDYRFYGLTLFHFPETLNKKKKIYYQSIGKTSIKAQNFRNSQQNFLSQGTCNHSGK